jgi:hypothetical protein
MPRFDELAETASFAERAFRRSTDEAFAVPWSSMDDSIIKDL